MVTESRGPNAILEGPRICTPFIRDHICYYGFHDGVEIKWMDLRTFDEGVALKIEETPCVDHISSPAVYDEGLYYHGDHPGRTYLHGQDVAPFYFRKVNDRVALCKQKGIQFLEFDGGWKPTWCIKGPYRHAHFHNGWVYFSRIGEDEHIRALSWYGEECVYRPDLPYARTRMGHGRHEGEVRDPFVSEDYFACVTHGERKIQIWRLS